MRLGSILKWLANLFSPAASGLERPSPQDLIPESSITIENGILRINLTKTNIPFSLSPIVPRVWVTTVADTNSEDPVFDYGNTVILLAGADEDDHQIMVNHIKVGDIAVYQTPNYLPGKQIIHRVIEISRDEHGRYFIFKGDNNATPDPVRVRDVEIRWLFAGMIC